MKRRSFLKSLGIGGVAVAIVPASALSNKRSGQALPLNWKAEKTKNGTLKLSSNRSYFDMHQNILEPGKTYRVRGSFRSSDDEIRPFVSDGKNKIWEGVGGTDDFQYVDATFVAESDKFYMGGGKRSVFDRIFGFLKGRWSNKTENYVEFDDLSVTNEGWR